MGRVTPAILAVSLAVITGCVQTERRGSSTGLETARVITAVRAPSAPRVDGRLDDDCWAAAEAITGFLSINSVLPAAYQSIAYVCYDESHLYIGMKCLMPEGGTPAGKARPHDTYLFSDDIVEIMIDPGRLGTRYYQLAMNAYGATYDSVRQGGGAQNDPAWNGDWTGAAHIAEGWWSAELAVPFHSLGMTPNMGAEWGINLCREAKVPRDELSSIAVRGTFNSASDFAVLRGLDADFAKYNFQIGPGVTRLDAASTPPRARFAVPVANGTGRTRTVTITRYGADADGKESVESQTLTLRRNERVDLFTESLAIERLLPDRSDGWIVRSAPTTKRVVVSDASDGTILALSQISPPRFFEPMRIVVDNAWRADMASGKTSTVSLTVSTLLHDADRAGATLEIALVSKESGEECARLRIARPSETAQAAFATRKLPWGAYEVRAAYRDASGREIAASKSDAVVLPGGRERIRVLNNLVSELMDTEARGLTDAREVAFMNPRAGWVFLAASGEGIVRLNGDAAPVVAAQAGAPAEAMCLLPAGRHTLRVEGRVRVIARAVPELMFSCHPSNFTWDFLKTKVLPDCNTILGGAHDPDAMREWTAAGRKWVTFAVAPSHGVGGEEFYPADRYYEAVRAHEGFAHAYAHGMTVDQIGSSSLDQKIEIARALARIAADPAYKGRAYQPWYEGVVFGSEGDKAMMKVVLEAGWPLAYYVYLVEQTSEAQTAADIRNTIVRIFQSGNEQIPNAMRRAVVTLGYWSDHTSGQVQDIDPSTNFKVLMQKQMEALANDPALFGVYGILWYYSPYVDEEILRWSSRLYRHYGIEGKRTPLTTDPYRMAHLANADFERGTEGWTVAEAAPGAVTVKTLPGFGNLQGRYLGGSRGDSFLVTTRSAQGPNTISQVLRGLTPGRAYSLKMITADYDALVSEASASRPDAVSIALDGAEWIPLPGKNAQTTFPNHYAHELGRFKGDYHFYMNRHWYVFRAQGDTATLTISDWASPQNPGGAVGGRTLYNFIQVEPYFE